MFRKRSIDVLTAADRLGQGIALIDVRTKDEWRDGHVSGAVRVSLASLPNRKDSLQRQYADRYVMVICRSGSRSAHAVNVLRDMGIPALNVKGGINAWKRKGLPVKRGS